jgi:hypothetical protein
MKARSRKREIFLADSAIQVWNQLTADTLWTLCCKPINFKKRTWKLIQEVK